VVNWSARPRARTFSFRRWIGNGVFRFPVHGDADDQSDLSQWRLDDRRHDGHHHRRQLLRRSSGCLRQHARLERGTILPATRCRKKTGTVGHWESKGAERVTKFRGKRTKSGGIFNDNFIANLLSSLSAKKLRKIGEHLLKLKARVYSHLFDSQWPRFLRHFVLTTSCWILSRFTLFLPLLMQWYDWSAYFVVIIFTHRIAYKENPGVVFYSEVEISFFLPRSGDTLHRSGEILRGGIDDLTEVDFSVAILPVLQRHRRCIPFAVLFTLCPKELNHAHYVLKSPLNHIKSQKNSFELF